MADDRCDPYQGAPACGGRKRGNQSLARTKGGLNTKLHLAVDGLGMPVKMIITDGNVADCTQAEALIEGLPSACLMADKAYDTNALLDLLAYRKTEAVIPPKRNRKVQRAYDEHLYKLRHIIENTFLKFKTWRSIATRYAKTTASFQAECQLAAIMLWLR